MPYCLNPVCPKPINPDRAKFCQSCGMRLRLGDRYQAFKPLGNGQSSRTFLAIDTRQLFDSRCVIKQYKNAEAEAFRRDVAQLAELSRHPKIPDLLAYFEREGRQYLVQQWIEGRNLLQQMQELGVFDEAQIRQVLQEVLPLLKFLHDRQIIHRDIKPTNLIYCQDLQQLILVDFGAVKQVTPSALGKTGTVVGSADYVAPEQLMGKAVYASDLYSLGATCLHLLTGLQPFELFNSTDGTWLWRSVSVGISDRLGQILDRLVQGAVNDRYQSAAEVWCDLNSLPTHAAGLNSAAVPLSEVPDLLQSAQPIPERWNCVQTLSTGFAITAIALSLDEQTLAVAGQSPEIQLWNPTTGALHRTLTGQGQAIAALTMSLNGQTLVAGDWQGNLMQWDLTTATLRRTLAGHVGGVTALAIAPDCQTLITSGRDNTIKLWDLATGNLRHSLTGHRGSVTAIALSPNGQLLASGGEDGAIKLWHLETQELLRTLAAHAAQVSAIALSAEQPLIASGSWDMTLRLRNLQTGAMRYTLTGHLLPITTVALSADSQILATGSHDDTIKLWSFANGKLILTLSDHQADIEALCFTAQSSGLLSGSRDGTVKLWKPC